MLRRVAFAFSLAVLITPIVSSAADTMKVGASALHLVASLSPLPAHQGPAVVTVAIKDANGKPVKGASVKVASNMPTMSMTGPTTVAHESAPGTYTSKINLNFATRWRFDVTASVAGKSGATHLSAEVK